MFNTKWKNLTVLLLGLWLLPLMACGGAAEDLAVIQQRLKEGRNSRCTWVFYGDSITHGALHTHGWRAYPEIFQEMFTWELRHYGDIVINAARSGWPSEDLLANYDTMVRDRRPDVVFLKIGSNDIPSGVSPDAFRANLDELVKRVRTDGAIPILQTSNTIEYYVSPDGEPLDGYYQGYILRYEQLPAYMEVIRQAAADNDVILIDHFKFWQKDASDPEVLHSWLGETIHPGALGHLEMAALIFKAFGLDVNSAACLKEHPDVILPGDEDIK